MTISEYLKSRDEVADLEKAEQLVRSFQTAKDLAKKHPNRPFQVYRNPGGWHWVRQDNEPLENIDGIKVVHIATFLVKV